jgi:hypothetical protein
LAQEEEFEHAVKLDLESRVREGVKAVLEEVLQEEMTEHLKAGYRELTPARKGERNGHYTRNLLTPAGKIERLEVPRDREGEFVTEVFERYKRMTGSVEEAILEMYLSGVSTRKIAGITDALSRVRIGKDVVSRIAKRLEEQQRAWRERRLEKAYPYLYLDATYLKVNWGTSVTNLALLACVGGGRGGLSGSVGGGGRGWGEERGLRFASSRSARPGTQGSQVGHKRRPRGDKGGGLRRVAGGRMATLRRAFHAQRPLPCASEGDEGGG